MFVYSLSMAFCIDEENTYSLRALKIVGPMKKSIFSLYTAFKRERFTLRFYWSKSTRFQFMGVESTLHFTFHV
jgi:hypothetical protein